MMLIVRTRGGDPPEKEENGRNARKDITKISPRLRRTWQENEVDRIKNELNSGYGYISSFSS